MLNFKLFKAQYVLVLLLILFLVILGLLFYFLISPNKFSCQKDRVIESTSPQNLHRAMVYRKNCHATVDYSGHLELDGKEVLSLYHYHKDFILTWEGEEVLNIEYEGKVEDIKEYQNDSGVSLRLNNKPDCEQIKPVNHDSPIAIDGYLVKTSENIYFTAKFPDPDIAHEESILIRSYMRAQMDKIKWQASTGEYNNFSYAKVKIGGYLSEQGNYGIKCDFTHEAYLESIIQQ